MNFNKHPKISYDFIYFICIIYPMYYHVSTNNRRTCFGTMQRTDSKTIRTEAPLTFHCKQWELISLAQYKTHGVSPAHQHNEELMHCNTHLRQSRYHLFLTNESSLYLQRIRRAIAGASSGISANLKLVGVTATALILHAGILCCCC